LLELIVRQNILSGRAGRIMRRWGMSRADNFLARYIDQVAALRASGYSAWMDAQRPDSAARLCQLILALAERIAPQFAWVPDGLSPAHITSKAYFALVDAQRIRSYTFDVPWEAWLRQFVWLRARQLSVSGPSRQAATLSLSYLNEESTLALSSACLCGRESYECLDTRLDLRHRLARLRPASQTVARMWLEGYSFGETAAALNVSLAAVNNRRTRIREAVAAFAQHK
jgi:DNA-directed RNA polymerase specialized sigma24 family protein